MYCQNSNAMVFEYARVRARCHDTDLPFYYHVARLQTLNEFYDTKVQIIEHLPPLTRKLIDDFVTNPLVVCCWLLFSCAC